VEKIVVTAIIAAAGKGKRMGGSFNKVLLPLNDKPVLLHSFEVIAQCPDITAVIVAVAPGEEDEVEQVLQTSPLAKPWRIVTGGSERQYTIANALKVVADTTEIVVIHDGARPLVEPAIIQAAIVAARSYGAAGVAVPVKDTIKIVGSDGFIDGTPDRNKLWAIQTPQVFKTELLKKAYNVAQQDGILATDDAALVERLGVKVRVVQGSYRNLKITTPEDLLVARAFKRVEDKLPMRFGVGYDVHRLVTGRKLILGGVELDFEFGLEGHSDADVLIHAAMDALLGAAALGDIGQHFPDTDEAYRGAASLVLLAKVGEVLKTNGWRTGNLDVVVAAEKPKLAPHIAAMRANIARTLAVAVDQISVKATTTEGLGFTGRREGIAAYAVASIVRAD
jgi:2-C-methyl-D-erythritol 4-phosphate cytidylyltransferase/2-C-methyl-D-erythritol 2,4-cyclodiphosphate synthase